MTNLEQVIGRDPALASEILQMSNSALYAVREPVSSVRRAIVVLDFNTVRSTVMTSATRSLFHSSSSKLKDLLLWEHSLAAAIHLHHMPMAAEVDSLFCAVVSLVNDSCAKLQIGPQKNPDLDLTGVDGALMLPLSEEALESLFGTILERFQEEKAVFDR